MTGTKTDEGFYEKARKLFISKASIDEFAGWATPRQVDAVHRLLDTELANRERAKHDRLLRRARFPVVKGLDGYDFTNAGLPDGYTPERAPGARFHPARAGPGVLRQDRARQDASRDRAGHEGDRHGTGRAVPPDGRARAPGWARPNATARSRRCSGDIGRADLIILDGSGYVPFDIDGARLP